MFFGGTSSVQRRLKNSSNAALDSSIQQCFAEVLSYRTFETSAVRM
jgi:hypothetical protein